MDNDKLFPVQEEAVYGIFPGKLQDGTTVIGFAGYHSVVIVYFAPDGTMLRHTDTPWTYPNVRPEDHTVEALGRALIQEAQLIREYLKSNGFSSFETVRVRQFWVDGQAIGLTQYPSHLQDVLEDDEKEFQDVDTALLPEYERVLLEFPADDDEEEMADLREELAEWRKRGDFVLHHGNDYWCDSDGYIHSS